MVRVTGINNLSSNHRVSVTTKANTTDKYRQIYTYIYIYINIYMNTSYSVEMRNERRYGYIYIYIYTIRWSREFRLKSIWIGDRRSERRVKD